MWQWAVVEFVVEAQSIISILAHKAFINIKIQEKEEFSVFYSLLTELTWKDYGYQKTVVIPFFCEWWLFSGVLSQWT